MNNEDIVGIQRYVVGFSKTPDENGEYLQEVEYNLGPIGIDKIREIFKVDPNDPDKGIADIIDPLDIHQLEADQLQPYVLDGKIDLSKYYFELHCCQALGYEDYWRRKK